MATAMAPGLQQVEVFQASPDADCAGGDAIISTMYVEAAVKQNSSSVSYCLSDNIYAIDSMAASGQSLFGPSGDAGTGTFDSTLRFNYYLQIKVTNVGGTVLSMSGSGASYQSEQAW